MYLNNTLVKGWVSIANCRKSLSILFTEHQNKIESKSFLQFIRKTNIHTMFIYSFVCGLTHICLAMYFFVKVYFGSLNIYELDDDLDLDVKTFQSWDDDRDQDQDQESDQDQETLFIPDAPRSRLHLPTSKEVEEEVHLEFVKMLRSRANCAYMELQMIQNEIWAKRAMQRKNARISRIIYDKENDLLQSAKDKYYQAINEFKTTTQNHIQISERELEVESLTPPPPFTEEEDDDEEEEPPKFPGNEYYSDDAYGNNYKMDNDDEDIFEQIAQMSEDGAIEDLSLEDEDEMELNRLLGGGHEEMTDDDIIDLYNYYRERANDNLDEELHYEAIAE